MPKVVGVRFRTSTRVYYFSPREDEEYVKGQRVVVETQRGVELATVALPTHDVEESEVVAPLKPIVRIATDLDLEAERSDNEKKREILSIAKEKVTSRGLDMKIVDCEFTVDHSKLVLYFTAESRVDFRDLVRDLATAFHIRIDLRQIGAREECKLIGSLGPCGQPCCCGRFESDSEHVSIKMAKNQNLALTPGKINGMCGRLLCCLGYENATYEDFTRRAPKYGSWVTAPDGRRGTVVSTTPLSEKVRVRFGDEDNFEFDEFDLADLKFEKAHNGEKSDQQKEQQQTTDKQVDKQKDRKNGQRDRQGGPDGRQDKNRNNTEQREKGGKNRGKNFGKPRDNQYRNNGADAKPDGYVPTDDDVPPPARNDRGKKRHKNKQRPNNRDSRDGNAQGTDGAKPQ